MKEPYPDRTNELVVVLWVIYRRPRDYPQGYVARKQYVVKGETMIDPHGFYVDSLEQARAQVPPGLVRMKRMEGDDPAICEVWI